MTPEPPLAFSSRLIAAVEAAVQTIRPFGAEDAHSAGLLHRCAEFRQRCERLAHQRAGRRFGIAFLGPKNAGKTTLLSWLIQNKNLRKRLQTGLDSASATERLTWIGPPPEEASALPASALQIPAGPSDFVDLGVPCAFLDVPGANERSHPRAQAAREALELAHLKVLVVEARHLEDAAILDYARPADGSLILPVVNQTRPGQEQPDFDSFLQRLRKAVPRATVLELLHVPDLLLLEPSERAAATERCRTELASAITHALQDCDSSSLLEPQIAAVEGQFRDAVREEFLRVFPAASRAAGDLVEHEGEVGTKALQALLGGDELDHAPRIALRQQLRAIFQERTPLLCFPWRTFLALSNLLHGALDKVPFLLMGSLPSLLSSTAAAVRNLARDRQFSSSRDTGLRQQAELLLRESLQPGIERLESALRSDLRLRDRQPLFPDGIQVEFEGLDVLQQRSTALFHRILARNAVSRTAAVASGSVGTLAFWVIFIWPIFALYHDYFAAVGQVAGLHSGSGAPVRFPVEGFPMILTGLLLALVPMLMLLLVVLAWAGSRGRAEVCLRQLQIGHHEIIAELENQGLLRIRTSQPQLRAWLDLYQLLARPDRREA